MQKKWYLSKTVWANIIALVGLIAQTQTGFVFTPESQAVVLTLLNLGLRTITKEEIIW